MYANVYSLVSSVFATLSMNGFQIQIHTNVE